MTPPSLGAPPFRRLACLLCLAAVAAPGAGVHAAAEVTVTGGADQSARNYRWIISHDHAAAISQVEIPQYRAAWAKGPPGWTADLQNARGGAGREGVCRFAAEPGSELPRGREAVFEMGIVATGTPKGPGIISVGFADGTSVTVAAEVPIKEPVSDRTASLIGLGVIFLVFVIARKSRRRQEGSAALDAGR
ncbi:MAG: hypothetical protein HY763_16630 [Planctomycetes bacterium]|nr:hypothetical protein [Planctomycetota bacterium]